MKPRHLLACSRRTTAGSSVRRTMKSLGLRQVGFCQSQALGSVLCSRILPSRGRQTCAPHTMRPSTVRWASNMAASAPIGSRSVERKSEPLAASISSSSPCEVAKAVEAGRRSLLSADAIPVTEAIITSLRSCLEAAAALHTQLKRAEAQSRASASRLAALGAERTGARLPIAPELREAVNKISQTAYTIIKHPNVNITPSILELYVQIQAQLGRPEPLPYVLELYATKAKPTVQDGKVVYKKPFPNLPSRAVEVRVADLALRTAIEAKHLDSALGIIEATYSRAAFRRHKALKYTSAPAMVLAAVPFGVYGLASYFATHWQNTFDVSTATGLTAAGLSGYLFVTGSLGMIAKLTYNDHMKRVTWTPGTRLRDRWLREEERAAFDKVACAWGFKEEFRHGEETGADWEGLKDYIGYRQMTLDRIELMDGMK